MRFAWIGAGLISVGIGGIGVVIPGLPTTVFMIIAAWCFSKSSPRLEQWVLDLPGVGVLVSDYRDGLGMPRRAKRMAIGCIVFFVGLSTIVMLNVFWLRLAVLALGVVGVAYVRWRVPTRETIEASRAEHQAEV
jgi:uncharacterized membrane protein YbaN (DUF454 family)